MRRSSLIVLTSVVAIFLVSWIWKGIVAPDGSAGPYLDGFLVTLSAFLTLAIMSFLYKDNPYYKFAEHLFVGVSAAYWMTLGFWSTIVGNLVPRVSEGLSGFFQVPYQAGPYNFFFVIPIILGILLLMRLSKKFGWISRWPLAFIVGTTAGLNFVRYLRSDFIKQVEATFVPLVVNWRGFGDFIDNLSLSASGQLVAMITNWVIFVGVFSGLVYFYFSKEHKGVFGGTARLGIWILMITFGASFGYTVMGRISLLVGRLTFLFGDWLGLIG
ncbi:MAG: hypothetical protein V3T31_02335 [candidate division Zixibacteria bacterium]